MCSAVVNRPFIADLYTVFMRPIDRVLAELSRRGLKPVDLAARLGVKPQHVTNWKARGLPADRHEAVAQVLGWTVDHLLHGGGAIAAEPPSPVYQAIERNVPMLDVRASAGLGELRPEHDPIIGSLTLNSAWVRDRLRSITSIDNLVTLIAHGDSMQPAFCDGSILLIDRGVRSVTVDGIYVLSMDNQLYVKRVTRRLPDGALVVTSDNPAYARSIIENGDRSQVDVLGKVAWTFDSKGA
jgi:hypothetical protein